MAPVWGRAGAPLPPEERIPDLDVLRGFAVLGILLMNIIGFSFHLGAYTIPQVAGGSTGIDLWTWAVNAVLVDGKMRGIFSMLFGAGIVLLTTRLEDKGLGIRAADLYFRRMLWLGVFGVAHAVLLWWGEILYPYAVAGLLLFAFRRLTPRALFLWAAVLITLMTAGMTYEALETQRLRDRAVKIAAMEKDGAKLTPEQLKIRDQWAERVKRHRPTPSDLEEDQRAFSSLLRAIPRRIELIRPWHNQAVYSPKSWDFYAMMLLGMALLKTGFLTGGASRRTLLTVAASGYLLGVPPAIWAVWNDLQWQFDIVAMGFSFAVYEPSRIAICLAHTAMLLLMIRGGHARRLCAALAAAGRMAFSNYVLQSLLSTVVFTGFALYGRLQRHQVYFVVAAIWALQLALSPWWLSRFRFGPLEWCWRSLTYWERQPMRVSATAGTAQ